jgi:hypothetical protein
MTTWIRTSLWKSQDEPTGIRLVSGIFFDRFSVGDRAFDEADADAPKKHLLDGMTRENEMLTIHKDGEVTQLWV